MQMKLQVSSSPHIRDDSSTKRIMLDVIIALLPAGLAGMYFFGLSALSLILVCIISAVFAEWAYQKLTHTKPMIGDLSAVVTGILLAYNLPANAPAWIGISGSVIAIILIKQLFGGLGQNFVNPALAARVILFVSFSSIMANYPNPTTIDSIASATPLAMPEVKPDLMMMFLGNIPGVLGETSKLAILLGGIYLIFRRVISFRIPVLFIATVFICYLLKDGVEMALYQILAGGLFLGAFFMATDYATSPLMPIGQIIMAVGCGLLVFVIRAYASYPEGVSFAILFMNVVTPLIDRFTMPRSFGRGKEKHA